MKNKSKKIFKVVVLTILITSFFSKTVAMERVDYAQIEQISLMNLLREYDFEKAKELIVSGKVSQHEMNDALFFTTRTNQAGLTCLLISKGAHVNAVDNYGCMPLHRVASDNRKEIVEILVRNGAILNAVDNDGWTPLHFAACKNNKEVVEILIKSGANVSAGARNGRTPLHLAVIRNYKESVELLIKGGASIDIVDDACWTPLHWAAISISANKKDKSVIKYLLFEGVNYKKKDKYQKTAYDVAKNNSIKKTLKDEKSIGNTIQSVREDIKREICATKCIGINLLTIVMNQQITGLFKPNRKLL